MPTTHRGRGRPGKLTASAHDSIVLTVGLGGSLEAAARSANVDPRSLRRWRQRGRRELDGLSAEAHLELALAAAEEKVQALSWRETAQRLDAEFGRNWTPLDDPELD